MYDRSSASAASVRADTPRVVINHAESSSGRGPRYSDADIMPISID